MRAPLLVILLWSVTQIVCASEPGSAPPWRDGQLVKVVANHLFAENEKKEMAGHPMFEKLKVQRLIPSESQRKTGSKELWIVSATVISTNTGMTVQETPIYVGHDDRVPILRAMSNRLGEVSFTVSPTLWESRIDVMPNRIYIGDSAFGRFPPRDSFVRRYWLRPTE
jgi:hypothetical protein